MSEKSEEERKRKEYSPRRPFPEHTFEEALGVAKAIQDKNAGKPWKPLFVAEALGIKPGSSNFRVLTSSAYKYGLTEGTWNAQYISLTDLGKSITKPLGPNQEVKDKQEAVLKIELFSKVYEHYRDSKFPAADDTYFKNMLEKEFGVPRELVNECTQLLLANGRYTGIIRDVSGAPYVVFAETAPEVPPERPEEGAAGEKLPGEIPPPAPVSAPAPQVVNQIFVAHGKNKVPLEQLKKILAEFKIPFKVAIDEPHIGRPIPQKVAELMRSCTSAIVVFTADEEYADADGKKIYRPSDNVVYELGAASILYGNKIVILKEDDVSLASDFSDLGYITFEKDKLDAKTMDLLKEFIGFGLLKVTPA
jgi:hypothetical protein